MKEEAKPGEGESLRERITTDLDKMEDPIGIKTKILQEVGTFGNVVVWGHETTAETDDVFVKGLGEWINFAESVGPTKCVLPLESKLTAAPATRV